MSVLHDSNHIIEIDLLVSPAEAWSIDECAEWINIIGLGIYEDCFRTNFIDGRKLVLLDISHANKLGIKDFEDLKYLTKSIRELLAVPYPDSHRTISLPHADPLVLFMEARARTGESVDTLTYVSFLRNNSKYFERIYGKYMDPRELQVKKEDQLKDCEEE